MPVWAFDTGHGGVGPSLGLQPGKATVGRAEQCKEEDVAKQLPHLSLGVYVQPLNLSQSDTTGGHYQRI